MKYPFPPKANLIARLALGTLVLLVFGGFSLAGGFYHTPLFTGEGVPVQQPIPFSHEHHVQGLGLDCRYCHTGVEKSSFANFPDSRTCYGCHSEVWKNSDMLKPVRDSVKEQKPLVWYRVTNLPDYVYFNHQIHIAKGIGCASCHGEVGRMPVVEQKRSFLMRDCLSCHRDPEKFVRPAAEVFNEEWDPLQHPEESLKAAAKLHVHPFADTDCNACHR